MNSTNMNISIITATHNSSAQIVGCLASVYTQSYQNIEHLIIDGASADNTLDIINSTPNRVTKIVSEPDTGIYDALNKGISLATGDVIGLLHSDDFFSSPQVLSNIAEQFQQKNIDGLYGNLEYVNKSNTGKVIRFWKSRDFDYSLLKFGWMPAHPTLFLKKSVYEKHGLFDLQFKIAADYDFMLRVLKDKTLSIKYLPEVITKMRVGGESNKSIKNIIRKSKEDYRAIRKNQIGGFHTLLLKNLQKINQFF